MNKIWNESCFDTMNRLCQNNERVDLIITSPPYATSNSSKNSLEHIKNNTASGCHVRYDVYDDSISPSNYLNFIRDLFVAFDRVLNKNGVILYNYSYSNSDVKLCKMYYDVLAEICKSQFVIADCIAWKKSTALPVQSSNKLQRVVENVFVICRKSELKTFISGKEVIKTVKNQKFYEITNNFLTARNNDGSNPLNKATFSSELVLKLLKMYCPKSDCLIYDPFMGTGTTAVACKMAGLPFIGSEISKSQVEYSYERLKLIKETTHE